MCLSLLLTRYMYGKPPPLDTAYNSSARLPYCAQEEEYKSTRMRITTPAKRWVSPFRHVLRCP